MKIENKKFKNGKLKDSVMLNSNSVMLNAVKHLKHRKPLISLIASCMSFALVFALASCSELQDSLSSEQNAKLLEETGSANLASDSWYYNGASSIDMTGDTSSVLKVSLSQKAAISAGGVSASYEVTYTDADGNSSAVTKKLEGDEAGYLSSDGKTFNLFMNPVLSILDGKADSSGTSADGTASVKIKLSGFVSAEGKQKGRNISALEKTVKVKPLFSASTLSSIAYSTLSSTVDRAIEIPALSDVFLSDDAFLSLENSSSLAGATANDFELTSDGSTIKIIPKIELAGKAADLKFTVNGISTAISGIYEQKFTASLGGVVSSSDSWDISKTDTVNYAMESVVVSTGETALTVTINSADKLGGWKGNRLGILIDDLNITTGNAISSVIDNNKVASYVNSDYSVEFYGSETMAQWDNSSLNNENWAESSNYVYYAKSNPIVYTIPYSTIDASAQSSDTFRVVVVFADNWDSGTFHVQNVIPASAATVTKTDEENDTLSLDFSKAIVIGASEDIAVSAPGAPKYLNVASVAKDSLTLNWSASYGATSYKITKKTADSDETDVDDSVTGTTYDVTGLSANTTYTFSVYAVNEGGTSSAKIISATTKGNEPGSFTINDPTFIFATAGTDVTLSWTESSDATSYKVEYKKAGGDDYTDDGVTGGGMTKTATLNSLPMGAYKVKVTAINGEGTNTETKDVNVYPTIDMAAGNTTIEDAFTAEATGASSTEAWSTESWQPDYPIGGLYLTNDADNLYILLKFNSVDKTIWENYRMGILIDNESKSLNQYNSEAAWNVGVSSTVAMAEGSSVDEEIQITYKGEVSAKSGESATISKNFTGFTESDSKYSIPQTVLKFSIPLSSIASVGNTVKVFAAVSQYAWGSVGEATAAAQAKILDCIPSSAASIGSAVASISQDNSTWNLEGIDLTLDTSKALSYTIK